ncbi:MAG: DUF4386 domain-containing protein [Saprospiraceae bacterium]
MAFLAYGFGRHLFEHESLFGKYSGALLIVINSIMVFIIGIIFRKTLQQHDVLVGNIYLLARLIESIALSSILLNLIPNVNISDDYGYFLAMLILGLGSIPMCFTLYKRELSPAWLAIWGVIGYAIFSFGFFMELFGREWSMYLLPIGGLWEITFAIWLIIKGVPHKEITL